MEMIHKKTKICFKFNGNIVNIPSKMYPLESNEYKVFTSQNTEEILDNKIINIFDNTEFNIGRCFTNSERLCTALNSIGYNAIQYVGWIFVGDVLPVHHSFVVLDNHVLDTVTYAISKDKDFWDSLRFLSHDKQYEEASEYIIKQREKLNHETLIFGNVDPKCIYIGSPATSKQGIERNKELRTVYPEHPCFKDVHGNSTNLQDIVLKKL